MALKVTLLLLAAFVAVFSLQPVWAEIFNEIHTDNTTPNSCSGSIVHIITEPERSTFHLTDTEIKDDVKLYLGGRPENAYVSSPTPWGDLYKTYNWEQVNTHFYPVAIEILNTSAISTTLGSTACENMMSDTPIQCKVLIQQSVTNSISHTRSAEHEISIKQDINYSFTFFGATLGGKTTFGYKGSWTTSQTETQDVTIDTKGEIKYSLKPGRKAVAKLLATEGTMTLRIKYHATLNGRCAVSFGSPYYLQKDNGHYFWAIDVNSVLWAGKQPQVLSTEELITVGYFSDINIKVFDGTDGKLVTKLDKAPVIKTQRRTL